MTELTPKGSKARAGLAASLLLHLAFVAAAVLSLPHLRPPPEPRGFQVSLAPLPPLIPAVRARARPQAGRPARAALAPPPTIPQLQVPTVPPVPALPAAPAAPGPGDDAEARSKVTGLLRGSVGCEEVQFAHLTREEQDRCARWRKSHETPGLEIAAPIEANKRAWFDATVAARNAPDHIPLGGCFGKPPPHAIKVGPCYIEPPKGPFSEDVDVPTEPEHSR